MQSVLRSRTFSSSLQPKSTRHHPKRPMRNMISIYRRELGAYFVAPIAYAVTGIFLLIAGFFFYYLLSDYARQSMMQFNGPSAMDVPSSVAREFFRTMGTIVIFMTPMLNMGIYSEDR